MPADSPATTCVECDGELHFSSTNHQCTLLADGKFLQLRGSSLAAIRQLLPGGRGRMLPFLQLAVRTAGFRGEVRIRRHTIAEFGPRTAPNYAARMLGLPDCRVYPLNLLRARLGT